jgi:hypothetical protein
MGIEQPKQARPLWQVRNQMPPITCQPAGVRPIAYPLSANSNANITISLGCKFA